jgi:hypothetical protein
MDKPKIREMTNRIITEVADRYQCDAQALRRAAVQAATAEIDTVDRPENWLALIAALHGVPDEAMEEIATRLIRPIADGEADDDER